MTSVPHLTVAVLILAASRLSSRKNMEKTGISSLRIQECSAGIDFSFAIMGRSAVVELNDTAWRPLSQEKTDVLADRGTVRYRPAALSHASLVPNSSPPRVLRP